MQKSIILLHGALGSMEQLKSLEQNLNESNLKAYSLNFSGHGQALFQNSFCIEQFAEELKLFISENNLSRPGVFGYSMGGYVALYLASQQNDLLGNIITLGTKFEWTAESAQRELKMLDTITITEKVPKYAEVLKARHADWKKLLLKTAEMMVSLGNRNVLNSDTFYQIENKVLMGVSDSDNMVTLEETDFAASQIKNSKRFTLQNAKHPIETVDVNVLGKVIAQFCG